MRLATAAVAALGLAVATYLTVIHYTGADAACFIAHGCTIVQRSQYATLAGVPVAVLGLVGYVVILAAQVADTEWTRTAGAAVAITGAGVSGWLTYVEVEKLDAICAWCVTSAVCMVVLAGLTGARLVRAV